MKKTTILFLFLLVSLFVSNFSFSQNIDAVSAVYADKYQQEKIHIQFDKSIYNKGETIWFKAYLMAANDLSDFSRNFYVDFFDNNGKLLRHIVSPLLHSSAKGQFDIPEKYSGQMLHVRAYTKWMMNFDTDFLYNKNIAIFQPNTKPSIIKPITTCQFFPEGGELLEGVSSKIAFMATDQSGKPISIGGVVKNSKGEMISDSKTQALLIMTPSHDGMGNFNFIPKIGETYTAFYTDEFGKQATAILPTAKADDASINVQPMPSKVAVLISRTEIATDINKTLNLIASFNQQIVYRAKVRLTDKMVTQAEIPTAQLPSGLLQITLFNSNWQPIAERVTFVNNHNYQFNPEIIKDTIDLEKRALNVIEINVPDTLAANLSVAITDAALTDDNKNNIVSQLLLCGDIKGFINNPAYYFSNNSDSIAQQLDLVMLTHGWRKYDWASIANGKMPSLIYPKEQDLITLKGKVSNINKILSDQEIFLILQGKERRDKQALPPLKIKPDGIFEQPGMIFFDTIKVFYQILDNKKLARRAETTMETNLLSSPNSLPKNSFANYNIGFVDTAQLAYNHHLEIERANLEKFYKGDLLHNVTVTAYQKKPVDILDEKYATGMFAAGDARKFDFMNDPSSKYAYNLFTYLQQVLPGVQVHNDRTGQPAGLRWRGANVALYVDEFRSNAQIVNTLVMNDIAYVKVFDPPFFGNFGGSGGAVAIYTRRGGDIQNRPGMVDFTTLAGYTPYKEFFVPNYEMTSSENNRPDLRTTIYWVPYVLTTKGNQKIKLRFYNNDITKKIKVIMEGVNADGKLARVEEVLE